MTATLTYLPGAGDPGPLTIERLSRHKTIPVPAGYPDTRRTFYAPIDHVHEALEELLNSCKQSLVLAMYGFDDDDLAGIIHTIMQNPHIHCQITLDKSQASGVHERTLIEKYAMLDSNSVAVGTSEHSAIMHRKMLIIDGVWTVTGSTNWSTSGETKQDNELTVTYDPYVAAEARHILDLEHTKALTQTQRNPQ